MSSAKLSITVLIIPLLMGLITSIGVSASSELALGDSSSKLPVSLFANESVIDSPLLSTKGSYLAMIFRQEKKEMIAIRTFKGTEQFGVPITKDATINWFRWASDDMLVISYAYQRFNMAFAREIWETKIASFDVKKKKFRWIRDKPKRGGSRLDGDRAVIAAPNQDYIVNWLPDEPDYIIQAVFDPIKGKMLLRKINIRTGKKRVIQDGRRGYYNYLFDKNNIARVVSGYDYLEQKIKYSYKSVIDEKWRIIREEDWKLDANIFDILAMTSTPGVAYVKDLSEHGTAGIFLMNLENGEIQEDVFVHPKLDARGVHFVGSTSSKSGLANQGPISSVSYIDDTIKHHYLNESSTKLQSIINTALPGTINTIVSQVPKQKLYIILSRAANDAGVYYLLNLKAGDLSALGERRPGLNPKYLGEVTRVSIQVTDGTTIPAYMTVPAGMDPKGLPTVVLPHGGPYARDYMYYDYLAQFIANRGYLVIQPNFRGSTGYGQEYLLKGEKQWGGLMQQDVTDTTNWLISQGYTDPNRICIVGWSYGGYAALTGAFQTPDLYKCAASINGVSNIPLMKSQDKYKFSFGRAFIEKVGLEGAPDESISPFHQANKINIPVLLVATKTDGRVPYEQSEMMHNKLKGRGISEFLLMEKGDHSIWDNENRTKLLNKLEAFLDKHIGN